jgi:hypothetical protein
MTPKEKESWWWFGAAVIGGLVLDNGWVFLGVLAIYIAYGMGKLEGASPEKADTAPPEPVGSRRNLIIIAVLSILFWVILFALFKR